MADDTADKTEAPTPRRLLDARRRGEIAFSRDLSGAAVFLAVVAILMLGASSGVARLVSYMRTALGDGFARPSAWLALRAALDAAAKASLPVLLSAAVVALGVGLLQTKGLLSLEALRVDPSRVMPKASRVWSRAAFGEIAKGLVKVLAATALVWVTVKPLARPLAALPGTAPHRLLAALGRLAAELGARLAALMVVLGAADYLWQRHRHLRKMRMTREEVKREHKETEGDPRHRAERHRLHQELLEQRMLAGIRKADFVVVNPDHIAVAVRYDREGESAPLVVAKGERLLAERIKELAREAGVPIFRDVALARSLRDVEEGDEIPEALYEAVAEILRVVGGIAS